MAALQTPAGMARTASQATVRRLCRDLEHLREAPHPHIAVRPSGENILEWHFVLHSLPSDTPYHGGCYHGRIIFQPEYPLSPPSILMCTPSGRFQTGQRLCLSMTDFHPEGWNPAWSVETILVGFLSFFLADGESGVGTLVEPEALRHKLAAASWAVNAGNPEFCDLFPEFAAGGASSEAVPAAMPEDAPSDAPADAPVPPLASAPQRAVVADASGGESGGETTPSCISVDSPRALPGAAVAPDASEEGAGAAEASAPSAASREGAAPSQSSELGECWICRDSSSTEPLMRPCACRGSMSGVHASCVERWIHHHQRTSSSMEPPRCPVCHQRYKGELQRPGLGLFMWQLCRRAACVFQQCALWVVLCNGFVLSVGSPYSDGQGWVAKVPIPARAAIVVVFLAAIVYTLAVLTVSLPPLEPPPQHPLVRRLFVSHRWRLVKHVADAIIASSILTDQYMSGNLRLSFFLAFLAAAAVPYSKCLWKVAGIRRNRVGHGHQLRHCCWLAAACIPMLVFKMLPRDFRRAVHPLGAGPHILAAVAVLPLCSFFNSNGPVLTLWAAHSTFLAAGLLEVLVVRRLRWQRGMRWAVAVWVAICAVLYANNINIPPTYGAGSGAEEGQIGSLACWLSLAWLCLVACLATAVNWAICVRVYRIWQRRHEAFTLQPPTPPPQASPDSAAMPLSPGGGYVALPDGP